MKREDILAKSRAESKDEMEEGINKQSFYWGVITLTITCIFFAITKVINHGQPFFEFPAILFAYMVGMNIYNYQKLKNTKYITMIFGFGFGFAFICMTVLYFINR